MRVLVFCVHHSWTGITRLPHALADAGFEVACLCDPRSYIARTRFLARRYDLPSPRPGERMYAALRAAVTDWEPVRIVPGDEDAVRMLHRIAQLADAGRLAGDGALVDVVRHSLGDPARLDATLDKHALQLLAEQLGIPMPASRLVNDTAQATAFAEEHGYPVVVKKSLGTGGSGVRVCAGRDALERAVVEWLEPFRHYPVTPRARDTLWRGAIVQGVKRVLRDLLARNRRFGATVEGTLSVQRHVDGTPAMLACVAHEGRVLADVGGLALCVHPPITGPTSVVHLHHRADMAAVAAALVRAFGFNGFASFDFVIEHGTGIAHLIECNPRPVPIAHLGARVGADLCAAWYAALAGTPRPSVLHATRELTVAMFPQELLRDPTAVARAGDAADRFHDVPLDDPTLHDALLALVAQRTARRP